MNQRPLPDAPRQRLPREPYVSEEWLERERQTLFAKSWAFAGTKGDLAEPGDYCTVSAGPNPLIVLRDRDGSLRGFHNISAPGHRASGGPRQCRQDHLVCPYHDWVYNLDGRLRGVPTQEHCFPDLDKTGMTLRFAAVGVFRDLVFVHPDGEPEESFEDWTAGLDTVAWPHDLGDAKLEAQPDDDVYEIKCNWKVFAENAIDGYHLAYLHKNTLGGPLPHLNT